LSIVILYLYHLFLSEFGIHITQYRLHNILDYNNVWESSTYDYSFFNTIKHVHTKIENNIYTLNRMKINKICRLFAIIYYTSCIQSYRRMSFVLQGFVGRLRVFV